MRWIAEHSVPNAPGDKRVIEQFIWFPKTLEIGADLYETRWLERCKISQVFIEDIFCGGDYELHDLSHWEDARWFD
jgi:hypothetical protein